ATGKVGEAFSLDGVNDYVRIPDAPAFDQTNSITVEAWMKSTGPQSDSLYLLVDKSHGWTDATGWGLQGDSSTGTIAWFFGDGSGFANAVGSPGNVLDGNWHHVAGTYDGAWLRLYVDGALAGALSTTALIG